MHDMSKFSPDEFIPYARYFYDNRSDINKGRDSTGYYKPTDTRDKAFDFAWLLHQKRNRHHWQWWMTPLDESNKCDKNKYLWKVIFKQNSVKNVDSSAQFLTSPIKLAKTGENNIDSYVRNIGPSIIADAKRTSWLIILTIGKKDIPRIERKVLLGQKEVINEEECLLYTTTEGVIQSVHVAEKIILNFLLWITSVEEEINIQKNSKDKGRGYIDGLLRTIFHQGFVYYATTAMHPLDIMGIVHTNQRISDKDYIEGGVKILAMTDTYRREMLCDWIGAGKAQGRFSPKNDPLQETKKWWNANNHKMQLHPSTRQIIESSLYFKSIL